MKLADIVLSVVKLSERVRAVKTAQEFNALQSERLSMLTELQKHIKEKEVPGAIVAAFMLGEAIIEFRDKYRELQSKF